MIHADGTKDTYLHDASGNVVKEILADGSQISYTYDLLNQCTSETDACGNTITYQYYPNGNPYKTVYPDGTYELYTYNEKWKVSAVTDRSGSTSTYEYDAMSRLTMERDALGNACRYEYDALGRLVRETDKNGNVTSYTYDANSNCVTKTNALGTTVHMEYDALNRMTRAYLTDSEGVEYSVSYTYDALGRVLSQTDEEGNTTCYAYDALGNVISVTDADGHTVRRSTYDAMGRILSATDALGLATAYTYDAVGNLLETAQQLSGQGVRTTSYTYDAPGRMTSATDALYGTTTACYDKRGNLASVTDANGGTTSYTYDGCGRLLSEESPLGSTRSYTYNARGLLSEAENGRGQKTAYTYDALGRITSMTDELGTVSYTYDANGNVLTVSDGQGTIRRKYDALDRVTEVTDYKGNTIRYSYDEIGNLIALTYPGGEIVRYTYYKNGLPRTVTDPEGGVTSYEYDRMGRLTRTVRPNGTEELCTYNGAGMLTGQRDVLGDVVLTSYTYTYDESGNLTAVEGTGATDTEEGLERLNSAVMAYDADNRLAAYNGEALRYDADGNMTYGPVGGEMTELVYDCRNRLVQAGDTVYAYDAENNRTSMETPDRVEEYVTDTVSAPLSRILTATVYGKETDGTLSPSGTTTLCVYGQGLISETTGGTTLYHHYDHLGSTRKLTDGTGRTVASYTYGTYGELLSGDTALTRFLYNGRCGVSTEDNGLYYMRRRYYNPETKRFINQDILAGSLGNSQSLNRYSYVQGNPVSYTDPFGLSPLNGLFTGTGLAHALLGLLGCIPGPAGVVFDLADAAVYAFVDHDMGMMALSLISAAGGSAAVIGGKFTKFAAGAADVASASKYVKMAKTARCVELGARAISNGATFLKTGVGAAANIETMKQKYRNGEAITRSDYAELGLNLLSCAISGTGMVGSLGKLGQMMKEDNVGRQMRAYAEKYALDNAGSVPNVKRMAGSETSYGKSSEKLNWDAIVSKKGETRVDHINRHAVPNNSRETHGVFNGNPIDMVNDAWEQRHLVEPISDGMGGTIYNIPYKNAGYESGYINTGAQMDYITIVTLDESADLITAFPSFGDYHK